MSAMAVSTSFDWNIESQAPARTGSRVDPPPVAPVTEDGALVETGDTGPGPGNWLERREERRLGVDALVNLHLPSAARFSLAEIRTARLVNVSRHGAQIACQQLPGIIGDRVQIDLPGLFGEPISLTASIVGIRARDSGSWTVSLRFVAPVGATRRHLDRVMGLLAAGR